MSALFFVVGLVFGSFGSVLITRIPAGRSLGGRSQCSVCKRTLGPLELIPLLSFCFLRMRCRGCKGGIAWLYPLLEAASGALFLFAWFHHQSVLASALLSASLWLLLIIAVIDAQTRLIPDALSVPLIVTGALYSASVGQFSGGGMVIGIGFFGGLFLLGRGKWIGSGDIILGAGIGALMGDARTMVVCLFLTYILGALLVCPLLLTARINRKSYVPFAPFLALGALVTIISAERIDLLWQVYFW